ncbi:MAG TPA: ATPase, partial [Oscillospiraceae bacterium]|nr:ATPase [Oscillospiraceae bacterium]
LLFGMMFGDLGQGIVISLIGLFMVHKMKMPFGQILTRIGVSSAVFGCVYGSVFGYEDALNPVYKALFGLEHKPIDVFEQSSTLLIIAVAIGAVLITISIIISMVLSFRRKDYEHSLFSQDGLAGLVFYGSIIGAVVLKFIFDINVINAVFITVFIAIPILLMFLREPLGKLIKYHKLSKPSGGIGNFIIESFVEMFEVMLSYITNTMSFLRVGGFVLSHAGMMLVVMVLSEKASGIANPIVVILGNIFVMGLEGLIVGIQVLRLEFYEIFSRFFKGSGKQFKPVGVSYDKE